MFAKVLVALDMSPMREKVFAHALLLAQKQGSSSLTLLHVLSSDEDNSPIPIPEDVRDWFPAQGNDLTLISWRNQWETYKEQGRQMLEELAQKAAQAKVLVDYEQPLGSPARTICQKAKEENIDLIIIGHRGRSGISEMILGSVSNYVLHHAPCSVLVVQSASEV